MRKDAEDQFVQCVMENKEDFYRLAYSYVRNQDDALDIVQESIQKGLVSLRSLKDSSSIKSWFYKIVVHAALDFLRKQKRLVLADSDTLEAFGEGSGDAYEDFDLHQAMDRLPHEYRTVVVLRFFEDLTFDEVAEVTGENVNTVKTRLYRALKLLRITIQEGEM